MTFHDFFSGKGGHAFFKTEICDSNPKKKSSNEKWAMELPNIPHKNPALVGTGSSGRDSYVAGRWGRWALRLGGCLASVCRPGWRFNSAHGHGGHIL